MTTLYSILLSVSGLSQREAADFHATRLDTLKNWCRGKARAPDGAVAELKSLIRQQRRAADELVGMMKAAKGEIELGLAADDYEARQPPLGWPCVSAQAQAIGMAVAMTDRPVVIAPRGTTPGTAAAAGAHDK